MSGDHVSDTDATGASPSNRSDNTSKTTLKRFYREATVSDAAPFTVLLDGRPVKTPAKNLLSVPNKELAIRIANEWASQGDVIDPVTLPLTRLVNSARDGVAQMTDAVAQEIVSFAGNDLISYRADAPEELTALQGQHWDPIADWAREAIGFHVVTVSGVMPIEQPHVGLERFAAALPNDDALKLAALHVMTTLTGSALIALAHARGFIDADVAWDAAHVDEDYQISQWGADSEAAARRVQRRQEFDAASTLYKLS